MIRYGFACKAIGVHGTSQKSLTLARASTETLLNVSRHNLIALGAMLDYCQRQGIGLLRISSDIIPLASHPQISFPWLAFLAPELDIIAKKAQISGIRLSLHPGQYTVLNSPDVNVVERSLADLLFHADFLQAIDAEASGRIILHIGGVYGNKKEAMDRFLARAKALPQHVFQRLSLENDERCYCIEDVLELCQKLGLPALFDVFHHSILHPAKGSTEYWLDQAASTWQGFGRQKIHYSQQLVGGKMGSHSQSISMEDFLAFHESLGQRNVDVMLEVKDKNLSALKCMNLSQSPSRKALKDEWARYKYAVMEHDLHTYQALRNILKSHHVTAKEFYQPLEQALAQTITFASASNTLDHIRGYFKKKLNPTEKAALARQPLMPNLQNRAALKKKYLTLAQKYDEAYLQQSLYFYM